MPLWGQRGHRRGAQSASGDLVTRLHSTRLDTSAGLPRIFDVSNPNLDADSSSSDEELHPSSRRSNNKRPSHSRSMSHPFPNPLAGTTMRTVPVDAQTYTIDRSDGDVAGKMRRQSALAHERRGSAVGVRDMTAGTCMTCGGTMRWPKDLKVFKCTLCATVNDLVPRSTTAKDEQTVPSLTLDHTKRLIRQSIRSYLCRRLMPDPLLHTNYAPRPSTREETQCQAPVSREPRLPADSRSRPDMFAAPPHLHRDISSDTHLQPFRNDVDTRRRPSASRNERPNLQPPSPTHRPMDQDHRSRRNVDDAKRIFKPLEDYIATCFASFESINSAFPSRRPVEAPKTCGDTIRRKPVPVREPLTHSRPARTEQRTFSAGETVLPAVDPKILLLGDVGENGTWWAGPPDSTSGKSNGPGASGSRSPTSTSHAQSHSSHSPQIHWEELAKWYRSVINAAEDWFAIYEELANEPAFHNPTERDVHSIENDLLYAQEHVQRHLMKATESLLKRPGRPLKNFADVRFLLITLENPLLHGRVSSFNGVLRNASVVSSTRSDQTGQQTSATSGPLSGQHSGLIKRVVGLMSNSSTECHEKLISWLARSQTARFVRNKDLISVFLTYRMLRSSTKKQDDRVDITAGLIPEMQAGRSGAYLHDEIGGSRTSKKNGTNDKKTCYTDDWQIKAAARVLALFFAANNLPHFKRTAESALPAQGDFHGGREGNHANGQILSTSDFYLSIIDYSADLVADFENWEAKRSKFCFCQYPFLLSIRSKTEILEHDARRQMQNKARDAFFDSIMSRRAVNQYLSLDVRRDCLVDDSLKAVSEVIGSGSEDVKKALRITFRGEEGIDGGGLRKEWFLMLIREVFNPDHGLFIYDDESHFCYFNPNSFETTDQFFLVGVVMGLAIYNSTILDVALPPFTFRKLLASAPAHGIGPSAHPRPPMKYTLDDLADYRPQLARGLKQLLEFEGDVESTFALDFAIDVEKYGTTSHVPLCVGGERKPVTNANRREFVDLYVLYMLDTSVKRQFEPFKRGFYTVCGGNAFSLFRPEEIELLVRGSDQPLDIPSLRAVATYDNWDTPKPNETEPIIDWFWGTFERAEPAEQRRLLLFITGSDRIPATGASSLSIRVACLGDDPSRFPIARTCFNSISLFRYPSREKLEMMLWRAVHESEGFGLK